MLRLRTMNHQWITDNQIIDRYQMRALSVDEEEEFEAHLLSCNECQEALKLSEHLVAGLQSLDPKEFKLNTSIDHWQWLAIAASIALVVSLVFSAWNQRQLSVVRQEPAQAVFTDYPILVLPLTRTRSAAGEPTNVIELTGEPRQFVFQLEDRYDSNTVYLMSIAEDSGKELWRGSRSPDYRGLLVIGVSSTLFEPGVFNLSISESASKRDQQIFSMRITAPQGWSRNAD